MAELAILVVGKPAYQCCDYRALQADIEQIILVATLEERERCARICEARHKVWDGDPQEGEEREWQYMADEAAYCAKAIRDAGEK